MQFAWFKYTDELQRRQALFEASFPYNVGTPAGSVEHYRWKYHGAPLSPPSYEYVATEHGEIIGYYGIVPYQYQIDGQELTVGLACDSMIDSEAQGKGAYSRLSRFAAGQLQMAEVDLLMSYPGPPQVISGNVRAGWQVAFELPLYVKLLGSKSILRSKHMSYIAPAMNGGIALYRALCGPRHQRGHEIDIGSPRDLLSQPSFATFVERWSATVPNHLVKSASFYDWRLAAPGTHYQALLVRHNGAIVAAAVGRMTQLRGVPSYALLDVMVLEHEQGALMTLYHAVDCEARRRGAEAVVTMMSRFRGREYRLTRFGFLKTRFTFKLIVQLLCDRVSLERILSEEDWHLMWIDSDDY